MSSKAQHINQSTVDKTQNVLSDYLMLVKPGLSSMVVFTAIASFLVASKLVFSWGQLLVLGAGGFFVTGASNTLNQVLEKDFDGLMTRTRNRPVTTGRISVSHATLFGGILCLIGVSSLAMFNVWASFLGMFAFITYAFVYTPMKRHSRAAVFVGAIAGAMPMAIGVVAFTGSISWLALILFAVQFAWQYPHFWAIGYLGHEDYNRAGFKFIPMQGDKPCKTIAYSSIAYSALLIVIPLLLIAINFVGLITGVAMVILGGVYLWYAILFSKEFDQVSAKNLMFSSLLYIPVAMMILLIDKV